MFRHARRWTPSDRAVWWFAFVVFSSICVLWAVASPTLSGPDEPAHVIRAAAIGHGHLFGDTATVRGDTPGFQNATTTRFPLPEGYERLHDLTCFHGPQHTADCLGPLPQEGRPGTAGTTAGTYQPLYYAAVGWVAGPLDMPAALLAMRALSALICGALIASAVVSLRAWPTPAAGIVGLLVATTPMALYIAGVVNPSGVEIAAALCMWTTLLPLVSARTGADRRTIARLAVATVALVWARPSSAFLAVAIVAAMLVLAADRETVTALARRWWRAGAIVTVATVGSIGWSLATGALDAFGGPAHPELTTSTIVQTSWDATAHRFEQMVGVLGWLDTTLEPWMWEPWLEVAAALLVVALIVGSWRQRGALVLLVLGVIALPILAEVRSARLIGYAWQGRYSLPVAVGIPLTSAWVIAHRLRPPRLSGLWIAGVLGGFIAVQHVLAHVASMRRYSLGRDALLGSYVTQPGWQAPIADVPLLLMVVAASTGLFILTLVVAGTTDGRGDPTDGVPGPSAGTTRVLRSRPGDPAR